MLRGIVATAVLALVVGLVVAGCGGGGGQSKEAFVQEANEICANVKKKKQAITNKVIKALPPGSEGTKKQAEQLFTILLGVYTKGVDEIEALTPPDGEEAEVEELTAAIRAASKKAEGNTWAVLRNKYIAYGEVNKELNDYGLKECAV